jgi:hypothetical protein
MPTTAAAVLDELEQINEALEASYAGDVLEPVLRMP